ncbi:unnamed protein product [Tetraodon nigroviridis]|uniref:(spotted green pufferfish) hypothetical protein n=1 Tax=Tetraodon nigroviridis TaxID=99883 RepID=Q4S4K1_TETNG|nr:unnamed protein product [Tetraodon nigroviridis]
MASERCSVETLADFGPIELPCSAKLVCGSQTEVFLCAGCDEIYVFSTKERKITASKSDSRRHGNHAYCRTRMPSRRRSFAGCPPGSCGQCADPSSRPVEVEVSSESLVVPEGGVCSLLLVGSELLTVSRTDSHWRLTLYRSQEQTGTNRCQTLTSFSLPLALDGKQEAAVKRRPVLTCVHYGDKTPSSVCGSRPERANDGRSCVDPLLFTLLFGVEAALAGSPVVLCGLPDGCLYFLPLRSPGAPRALCSLQQPVIAVGASSFNESGPQHAQCLLAMGEQGRVVLIRARRGEEAPAACFLDRCLPGTLVCGCIGKNTLYYSVGSDFLKLDLSRGSYGGGGQNGEEEEASRRTEALHRSPTSLNVCGIVAVAELSREAAGGEAGLLGLSVGGQLRSITVPSQAEGADSSRGPPGPPGPTLQVGRGVRDHLSAIGDVCERASVLKGALRARGQVLKQLNQVMNISFLLAAGAEAEEPIRCGAATEWSSSLGRDSLNLSCVLDNSSPYTLEPRLDVNIPPGGRLQVSLPLADAAEAFLFLPLVVSCSLIFSLSALLPAEEAAPPGLQASCISLPLNTLCVDWLHALQWSGPGASPQKDAARLSSTTTETIQAFIKSHQLACEGAAEGRGPARAPRRYSASVQVSAQLIDGATGWKGSGAEGQGGTRCSSFLEWLLSEGCGGVSRGGPREPVSSPVLQAPGLDGHAVTLTAKEVNVGEESTGRDGCLAAVLLHVDSSLMAAVCGLHHAVLRRLQLSPLLASCLFRIFSSRFSAIDSRGPSALARPAPRRPVPFTAFTQTLEKILFSSCN